MSQCIRKPTICICENRGADHLRGNHEHVEHLCFRYTYSTLPRYFLKPKFPASNYLMSLYSPVCVGPGRSPICTGSNDILHQENMPVPVYPIKHHFYIVKLGYAVGIPIFVIFAPKHRLWVLVRTASARRF